MIGKRRAWPDLLLAAAQRSLPAWAGEWAAGSGSGAASVLSGLEAYAARFRDDLGARRTLDTLVVEAILDVPARPSRAPSRRAERAWHAAAAPPGVLGERLREALPAVSGSGPLALEHRDDGIEAWTEQELASLHALERVAIRTGDAELRERSLDAVRWHLDHLQPDNGTNRPWAIGAFVREGSPEGLLHAETMLHACQFERGRADVLSAWLLLDTVRSLRLLDG